MTVRCLFITSSYLRTFLRISKFCCSICVCADWIALETGSGLDRHVLGQAQEVHHRRDPLAVEPDHQVVAEREVEPGLARVALAAGRGRAAGCRCGATRAARCRARTARRARRPRRAPWRRLALAFSSASGQAASYSSGVSSGLRPTLAQREVGGELGVAAEHDVGAAAGHVRGDRDGALAPGVGDDRRLPRVLLGVEHLVRDALAQQQRRQPLGLRDATPCRPAPAGPSRAARRCRR